MLNRNDNYKSTRNCYIGGNTVYYIILHYTGCYARAKNFCLSQMNNDLNGSAHDFVDDYEWYCAIDHNNCAWAVGDDEGYGRFPNGITNSNSLNIEMCCCNANLDVSDTTAKNTAEIVAYYMKLYNVPIERVKRHYDASYKSCPRDMSPAVPDGNSRWGVFLSWVQKAYNGESLTSTTTTNNVTTKTYPDNEVEQYEGCKVFLTDEAYKYNDEGVKDGIPVAMKGKDNIWTIDHFAIVDHVFCGYIKGIGNIPQPMYRTVKDTPSNTSEMKDNMYVKLINEVHHGNGSQWKGQRLDYSNYSHTEEYLVTKLAINDHSFEGYINGLGWIPVSYFKVVGYKEEEKVEDKVTEEVENGSQTVYQVISGTFTLKENAEKYVEELKQKGIDSFIQKR